jgi:hypothetical protein
MLDEFLMHARAPSPRRFAYRQFDRLCAPRADSVRDERRVPCADAPTH